MMCDLIVSGEIRVRECLVIYKHFSCVCCVFAIINIIELAQLCLHNAFQCYY